MPTSIRGLALLSQLAVYKDLIPGYRIRQLTAAEEAEKVRDEVRRLREGEKMLVRSYKGYLKMLENEIKRAYETTRRTGVQYSDVDPHVQEEHPSRAFVSSACASCSPRRRTSTSARTSWACW